MTFYKLTTLRYLSTEMLLKCNVVLAISLLLISFKYIEAQVFLDEDDEGPPDIFDPVIGIPPVPEEILQETAEENPTSGPFFVKKLYHKGLPIFAPLKSILSWKENSSFLSSILQIKLAIELMHEKHESLLNHVKCVFPVPPKNCSVLQEHSSKWNWTSLIPSGFKPQSFFSPSSEHQIGPVAAVFIAAIEHLENKQNKIYEYLSCACEKKTNCTAKPNWNLFNGTFWHNKFQNLNPLNWHLFNISKPYKPSSGYFQGGFGHKPIVAYFNHSAAASGAGQAGFVVAVTGGHVPAFPTGIYGSTSGQLSAQEASEASGSQSAGGGFGGYVSASLPSYSGTVIVGNFPHSGDVNFGSVISGSAQGEIHGEEHSSHNASSTLEITGSVNETSSAEKPIPNSITVPKCPGSKNCAFPSATIVTNITEPLNVTEYTVEPIKP